MPIPAQYNDDFQLWWNDVSGRLSQDNFKFQIIKDELWAILTPAQKTSIKNAIISRMTANQDEIEELKTYLATL